MLGPIGNDILNIGSRKAAMAQETARAADPMELGRPGQFEVPNVMDVRYQQRRMDRLVELFMNLC